MSTNFSFCTINLTLSSSLRLVTMTMVGESSSHIILQKSGKVEGMGPWEAIYPLGRWKACRSKGGRGLLRGEWVGWGKRGTYINKGGIDVVRARSVVLEREHHTRVIVYI